VAVWGPLWTAPRSSAWVFVDRSTSRGVQRRCPSDIRSMSVRKVRRWSLRTEARIEKGMKAMGKRFLSSGATNCRRPNRYKGKNGPRYSASIQNEAGITDG